MLSESHNDGGGSGSRDAAAVSKGEMSTEWLQGLVVTMEALVRANDFVAGAEASFGVGALASCALCCYAAVFWAQIAVLEKLGFRQPRWSHDGLRNKFSLEAVKVRKLFDPEVVDHIRRAYYLRHDAHYSAKEFEC